MGDDYAVLVVEDDPNMQTMLRHWLLEEVLVPYEARTLADGFKMIAEREYAIVIVDIVLPDGNGLDLIKKLTLLRPQTRTIAITGHVDFEEEVVRKESGANDFLVKGKFSMQDLRTAIDQGIDYYVKLTRSVSMIGRADNLLKDCQKYDRLSKEASRSKEASTRVALQG